MYLVRSGCEKVSGFPSQSPLLACAEAAPVFHVGTAVRIVAEPFGVAYILENPLAEALKMIDSIGGQPYCPFI